MAAALPLAFLAACHRRREPAPAAPAPVSEQPAPAEAPRYRIGQDVIQAMHDRYADQWYSTLTFKQKTSRLLPSGKLVRWRSPKGTPLRIAAAAPVIPWTDLIYAAAPNGLTRANGQRFRDMVLSRGNTLDYAEMYRSFTGHDPDVGPMLEFYGLPPVSGGPTTVAPAPMPTAATPKKGERG